jgi:hypothetical protein
MFNATLIGKIELNLYCLRDFVSHNFMEINGPEADKNRCLFAVAAYELYAAISSENARSDHWIDQKVCAICPAFRLKNGS